MAEMIEKGIRWKQITFSEKISVKLAVYHEYKFS